MPLNINLQQILLHMLNFVILFGGLFFLLYKPVVDFMKKREARYREMDETAQNNFAESQKLKEEYEQKMSGAEAEIRELREKARDEIHTERAQRIRQAEQEAEGIIEKAHSDAMNDYSKIMAEAQKDIEGIVYHATKKVMSKLNSENYEQFLDMVEEKAGDA